MAPLVLEGTWTALVTPMHHDPARSLDLAALERLVEQQVAGGIDGLVACGTTGEASTLDADEYDEVVRTVVRCARGRVPVIAGTGSNDTRHTLQTTARAAKLGVVGVLVVTPYYNKPSQSGLLAHYHAVADASPLPVVLYNVPGRTGCNLLPPTVAALARHPNVCAVKEASGSLDQVQQTLLLLRDVVRVTPFTVVSGDDGLCVPMYSVGARGVISVVSNPAPARTAALWRDFRDGRAEAAARGQLDLWPLIKTLFSEPNPQPCKAALHLLGVSGPAVRLPLVPAGADTVRQVARDLQDLGLLRA
ncbi:MAG: 4-hydroxy-tetrahydrodipicolinate synthase [Myxococcales bacterium]|nr:4-hydroxy-tetrahydrodipicolinate synthase [Myxococcales bacterium]